MTRKRSSWRSTGRRIGKSLGRKSPAWRRNNFVRPVELGVELLEPRWVLAAGALDTTFDPIDLDGVLIGNLGAPSTANVRFSTITTQSDGKILAAGSYDLLSNNEQDFVVARFNPNGSLDTTFGIDGPDAGTTPDGFINFDFSFASSQNFAEDITLDSLGRIIVVGSGPASNNFLSWTVARLTPNGLLDTTFNGTGKVVTPWVGTFGNVGAAAHGVAVQADGKIVVAGDVRNSIFLTDIDFGLARYNDNGTLDSTFGTGGKVVTDFFARQDQAFDVEIQPNQMIVAGGSARTATRQENFALARYDAMGNLDPTFGLGGLVSTDIVPSSLVSQDIINAIKIQPNGQIVATGWTDSRQVSVSNDDYDFIVARYQASGALDTTFAPVPAGSFSTVPGTQAIDFTFHTDKAAAVGIQADGKYVIAGSIDSSAGLVGDTHNDDDAFGLARLATTGSLDPTFGTGGRTTTRISDYVVGTIPFAIMNDMALQPDGKIVATGYTQTPDGHEKFIIARYESGVATQTIAGPSTVAEGGTYTLTLSSSDPTTSQWTINWGNGIQVVPGNPSSVTHVYADGPQNYTISASVTTSTGTTTVGNTVAVSVLNVSPTLSISGASSVNEGATYTLNLSSTDPGTDTIGQWTINWGDSIQVVSGNPSSVTHTYADGNASRTISASATDEDGTFAAGNTVSVAVQNVAPTLTISGAADVNEGSPYTLTLSSFDPGADTITTWTINWGDGTQIVSGNPSSVSHTYADGNASRTISATATDEDGTFAAGNTVAVSVHNVAPTLTVSGASDVNEGSLYTLSLSSLDPGTDTITQWAINWGDSTQVVSGNPTSATHTYADGNAAYSISATATDEDGTFSANTVSVTVHDVAPTLAISGAANVNEGSSYTLNLTSSDPGSDAISQWTISWGDSTQVVSGNPSSTTHTYADGDANYTISATATNEDGTYSAGNSVLVAVLNVAPALAVSGSANVDEGSSYTLNLSSSDPGADTITSWTITWGDGNVQTIIGNPSSALHTYADGSNSYTISATATDEDGTFAAGNTVGVTVNNVAPTLTISGAANVNEGSSYTLNLTSSDPGSDTINHWTINWGDSTQVVAGNPSSVTHTYADGDASYTISATATDEDGTFPSNTVNVTVHNVAPTANNATFTLAENSPNGTVVGTVTATDPGDDTLSFSIVGGTGAAAFAVNSATGQITVANSSLLDFETTPTLTLNVQVSDGDGGFATASVTINLVNLASISGAVFVDVNQNGSFECNEPGIDGVVIKLLDQSGNAVLDALGQPITETTSNGGLYIFDDLAPGTYQLFEMQPTGVTDGAEHLGSLGGTVVGNDRMRLNLAGVDAYDYAFAEIGQQLTSGDAATIGFWQNKSGQALITQGGTQLAAWLTSNFSNIFGNALAGATGADVATFYREQLFKQQSKKSAGPAKVDAQFMAVALATYFTSHNLAGSVATSYGFHVTDTGIGTKIVNVGTKGAAFNTANGSDRTIMQLLTATNSLTDQPNAFLGIAAIYDTDGNGVISSAEAALRAMANDLFTFINESGGV